MATAGTLPARGGDSIERWTELFNEARRSPMLSRSDKEAVLNRGMPAVRAAARSLIDPKDPKLVNGTYRDADDAVRHYLYENTPEAKAFRTRLLSCTDSKGASACRIRDLYSEMNLLAGELMADSQFSKCQDRFDPEWIRSQGMVGAIRNAQRAYQPICEGASNRSFLAIFEGKGGSESSPAESWRAWPLLYSGDNTADLLNRSEIVLRKFYVDEPAHFLDGAAFPTRGAMAEDEYGAIKSREELKQAIYLRAVTDSVKTKMNFEYFFGARNYAQLRASAKETVKKACAHCTPDQIEAIANRTLNSVSNSQDAPTGRAGFEAAAIRICNDLSAGGYFKFDGKIKEAAGAHSEADADATRIVHTVRSNLEVANAQNRRELLSRLIRRGDQGLLLLTDRLTTKSGGTITGVNLRCRFDDPASAREDAKAISEAITQAEDRVDAYLESLNEGVSPLTSLTQESIATQDRQLKALVRQNSTAAGEALADFPMASGALCDTLVGIFQDQLTSGEWKAFRRTLIGAGAIVATVVTGGLSAVPFSVIGGSSLILTLGSQAEREYEHRAASAEQNEVLNALYGGQGSNDYLQSRNSELLVQYEATRIGIADLFDAGVSGMPMILKAIAPAFKGENALMEIDRAAGVLRETVLPTELATLTTEQKLERLRKIEEELRKVGTKQQSLALRLDPTELSSLKKLKYSRWYTINRAKLESIRSDFGDFALDIGLTQKLEVESTRVEFNPLRIRKIPGFIAYAKAAIATNPSLSAREVYESYREALGTREIFRVLALDSEDEAKRVLKMGMSTGANRSGTGDLVAARELVTNGWDRLYDQHFSFETVSGSPFMSVSGDGEFAAWAAGHYQIGNDKQLYSFRLRVWNLDLIETKVSKESHLYGPLGPVAAPDGIGVLNSSPLS